MKKIISMFLSVLMVVTCISFNTGLLVYADTTTFTPSDKVQVISCITLTNKHDGTVSIGNLPTFGSASGNDKTYNSTNLKWGYEACFASDEYFFTEEKYTDLNTGEYTQFAYNGANDIPENKTIDITSTSYYNDSTPKLAVLVLSKDNANGTGAKYCFGGQIFTLPTKVTYDLQGGAAGSGFVTTDWVLSGEEWLTTNGVVNHSIAPTKDGYTFDGWYTAAEGGTKVTTTAEADTAATSPTSGSGARSVTLYAHWTPTITTPLDFTNVDTCTAYSTKTNGVQWDDTNKTLTLENVDIDCLSVGDSEFAIKVPDGTTIDIIGSNKVKAGHNTDNTRSYGIYGVGDIYFTGSGSLDVTSAAIDISNNSVSTAIIALKSMTIGEDVAIKAKAYSSNTSIGLIVYSGNLTNNGVLITTINNSASNKNNIISIYVVGNIINNTGAYIIANAAPTSNEENTSSYGIYTTGNVSNYGTLATRADVAYQSIGLYLSSGSLTNSGAINCVGGENAASVSYGIYVDNNLTNNTGAIIAGTGNKASTKSNGIKVVSGNVYNYGTLNAYGNDSKLSKGLSVDDGDLENYGTIDATSGATTIVSDEKSYGIYVDEDAINTGTITASSGSSVTSTGLFVNDRLENRGEIIGNGGLAKNDSNGVYIGDDITNYVGATITGTGGEAYVSFGVEQLFGDLNNYGTIKGIGGDAEWSSFGVDSDTLIIHSSGLVDVSCDNSATNNDGLSAWYLEMSAGGLVKSTGDVECNISKTLITSSPFEYTNATFECEEVDMGNYKYECLYSPSPAGATLTLYVSAPAYKVPKTCVD